MKKPLACSILLMAILASPFASVGQDYKAMVKLSPKPKYLCAMKHYHLPGIAENTSDVTLVKVRIEGKVYDKDGTLLGTATDELWEIGPKQAADFDLEFVEVKGKAVARVTDYIVEVVHSEPKR
ncbi:MAG: hypothetical protein HY347_11480 [candidate division NC10 bacterium]|nr:hypothetical protein [candidate division NC10 bacterium]